MSVYKFQAKATDELGCEFRSKLEAQWAYYFNSRGLDWAYADKSYYDFEVNGIKIEVKPRAEGMLLNAVKRIPQDKTVVVCVFGHPPNIPHEKRFSPEGRGVGVCAFSAWYAYQKLSEEPAFMIRSAHVGLWLDDVFFKEGCTPNGANGIIGFEGDVHPYSCWYPSCSGMIRDLISLEQRRRLSQLIIMYAEHTASPLMAND